MIRKLTTYSIALFANIILLAFTVVPHHHHEKEVCVVSAHCDADSDVKKHKASAQRHAHDGESKAERCGINQIFVIPNEQHKSGFEKTENTKYHFYFKIFPAAQIDQSDYGCYLTNSSPALPPDLSFNYVLLARTGLGLRAPPIV